ncbi:UMP kinase [Candidatus Woesearchaeota archaeon]|nr:UMP kinase [Candidatus Woesearchaeota archaeon]
MAKKEVIIVSVGGSVIVPDNVDIKFLKGLRKLVKSYLKKYRFVLITGGGKTARVYQGAAGKVKKVTDEDKDWLGIHATRLNAHLLRTIFREVARPAIVTDPTMKVEFDNVLIAAGWKPGFSTDYDAVMLAQGLGAKTVINITNIDYLYDKDPRKSKSAKKIEKIDWKGFRKIVGDKWSPGLNAPFDPIASKLAQKLQIKLVLIGRNLNNLKNFLDGKKFKGSSVQ